MKRGLAVAVGQCWICTGCYQLLHDHHSTKLQSTMIGLKMQRRAKADGTACEASRSGVAMVPLLPIFTLAPSLSRTPTTCERVAWLLEAVDQMRQRGSSSTTRCLPLCAHASMRCVWRRIPADPKQTGRCAEGSHAAVSYAAGCGHLPVPGPEHICNGCCAARCQCSGQNLFYRIHVSSLA